MKKATLKRILIAGILLLTNQIYAQNYTIDSVKLIPNNPTTNDILKVVCYTTFTSGSCILNSADVEQQGNVIFLSLNFNVGAATYICHSVDTITIQNPGTGTFQLTTTLTANDQDILYDVDNKQFTIDPYLGISEYNSTNFQVFPNPFQDQLNLKTTFAVERIEIQSISGQNIKVNEYISGSSTIDVSNLKQGVYFLTLIDKDNNRFTQRIVKNNH